MSTKVFNGLDMQSTKIENLAAPVSANDAVRLADLNSAIEGLAFKDSVRVSSTANINLASPGATIDGVTMVSGDRFLAKDQTTQSQNGIYVWNGAATPATRATDASTSAELEGAVVTVEEGTSAGATFRQTQVNFTLDTNNVLWTSFGTSAPAASETTPGIAELATQSETDTGTDDNRTITPLKLANWSGRVRKASGNIGDGSATQIDVTHNFATRAVKVEIYRNSSPWDTIITDISRPDTNTVRFNFAVAPTSNQFSYTIWA